MTTFIKNPDFGQTVSFTIVGEDGNPRNVEKEFNGKITKQVLLDTDKWILSISEKAYWKLKGVISISSNVMMTKEQVGQYPQLCFYADTEQSQEQTTTTKVKGWTPVEQEYWISDEQYEKEIEELLEQGIEWNEVWEHLENKYGKKKQGMTTDEVKFHLGKLEQLEERYSWIWITEMDQQDATYMMIVQDFKEKGLLAIKEAVEPTRRNFTY